MADYAAFFLQGELVETRKDKDLFIRPQNKRTQDYVEANSGDLDRPGILCYNCGNPGRVAQLVRAHGSHP